MRVSHCEKKRQTSFYWLTSKIPAFDYEIIARTICPKCGKTIMEYYGLSLVDGYKFIERVKLKHNEKWEARFKSDLIQIYSAEQMEKRNTKAKAFVGEYTQKASRDPAEARHYVLNALKQAC